MPKTILVVEDELALRETLTYNLQKEGYVVEAVSDGRTALEAARVSDHNGMMMLTEDKRTEDYVTGRFG